MSVLIKGMEMPKEGCKDCLLVKRKGVFDICPFLKREVDGNVERGGKPFACPLVSVSPHGRLIDADTFATEMKKRQEEAGKWLKEAKDQETAVRADAVLSFLCEVKLTLDAAPTIIEAEEEQE